MNDDFRILIVDDEPNIRQGLAKGLGREADRIEQAGSVNEALELCAQTEFELIITDVRLPGDRDGLDLVSLILDRRPETTIIVITAYGTVETAVDAMKRGAFDFITKPIDLKLIRQQVSKAAEHHRLQTENRVLRDRLADAGEFTRIIGSCPALQAVLEQVRQVADTDATVLIQGESGTGKELLARSLHDLSSRASHPFIAVNLGALPDTLLESELFGHEKGAFTGATRQKPGCFEQAGSGTLFLDEITEMSPKSQVDLLRVLETQQFMRLGGEETLTAEARIVAATNQDIEALIQAGDFREDLFYRLNVVPLLVPPLRQRTEDIPLLINHFLNVFAARYDRPVKQMTPEAIETFVEYDWPGNIRQLKNVIERLSIIIPGEEITLGTIPAEFRERSAPATGETLAAAIERAEIETIQKTLQECQGHREKTAKRLDISVRTLHYKMNRYGLY